MTAPRPHSQPGSASELLPCPFCAKSAHICDTGVFWVACDECDAEGPFKDNDQDAIKAWNTRSPSPDGEREALARDQFPIKRADLGYIGRNDAVTNESFEPTDESLIFLNGDNEQTCYIEGPNAKAMARQIVAALRSPVDAGARETAPLISIKTMRTSDGGADYFVSIKIGDREITPYKFRDEFKAAYEADSFRWLLLGTEKPDLMAYGPGGWPAAISNPPAPQPQCDRCGASGDVFMLCAGCQSPLRSGVLTPDAEKALRDEIWQLREIVKGVRLMSTAGRFEEYEGEPWLRRVQNIDLHHDPVATAAAFASSLTSAQSNSEGGK